MTTLAIAAFAVMLQHATLAFLESREQDACRKCQDALSVALTNARVSTMDRSAVRMTTRFDPALLAKLRQIGYLRTTPLPLGTANESALYFEKAADSPRAHCKVHTVGSGENS